MMNHVTIWNVQKHFSAYGNIRLYVFPPLVQRNSRLHTQNCYHLLLQHRNLFQPNLHESWSNPSDPNDLKVSKLFTKFCQISKSNTVDLGVAEVSPHKTGLLIHFFFPMAWFFNRNISCGKNSVHRGWTKWDS